MKNLFIFMMPILISYIFQQLYNAADTAIVGHFLGEQSLAAVVANVIASHTIAKKLFMLSILLYTAMGMAISTFVSQNKGAGQRERIIRGVRDSYV